MNFEEMKQELYARGTDYLEEDADGVARAERWLNQAYRKILNLQAWPFLQASAQGIGGDGFVTIPDLRKIMVVADSSQFASRPLQRSTYEELAAAYGVELTRTGTPEYYYLFGTDTIYVFPVGGAIFVQYIKRVEPLTGTDTPIFDEEYHNLIVDGAMIYAYRDGDNFEAAAALQAEWNLDLASMAEDYMLNSREPLYIQVVDPYDG
jgi:hypothetical protein